MLVALVIKGLNIWESKCHIDRSGSMQDFRDNQTKWQTSGHFGFYLCEFCHGLSLCETLHFVIYSWSSFFAFSSSWPKYHKITQIIINSF